MEPCFLTAAQASRAIAEGLLTSEALVRSCLDRIAERDPAVKAWLHVDPAAALQAARERDKQPAPSRLHGLPFGVKDMIDTADMPTTYNSANWQGHRPSRDAACVGTVRASGAIILGKTDTLEFAAAGRKAATRHPMNPAHTPGGSSSGSGAAVGDWQVPLAFGTQTGGSHIRPASFNGVYGLKPTWGSVSREGTRIYANSLDTIGWYGRSVEDLEMVAESFRLHGMGEGGAAEPGALTIALCRTPSWPRIEPAGEAAYAVAGERLRRAGVRVVDLDLPAPFDGLFDAQEIVMWGEGRAAFLDEYLLQGARLGPDFVARAENGRGITPAQLVAAHDLAASCRREFDAMFGAFDAVLAPAAPGEAPEGLHTTGSQIFNAMWTLLHVPCLAVPCTHGPKGLPVGIQLMGPRFGDARLMKIAAALAPVIDVETPVSAPK